MKKRVAEHIADYLAEQGFADCFMITGGGAMHLNDALGHHPSIRCIYNHHEQASAIAAEGYARTTGKPGFVCVTSGPGGTNTLTGVMGAWVDSIPMLVISGQVKRETTVYACPELPLRQLGDQEFDIVRAVGNMTKYAAQITQPEETLYHIGKALHLATTGRPGPVWLDIPLDVQGAVCEAEELRRFTPDEVDDNKTGLEDHLNGSPEGEDSAASSKKMSGAPLAGEALRKVAEEIASRIAQAKKPVFLAGTGIHLAGAEELLLRAIETFRIPVLTAWNANDLVAFDHPCYAGMPGTVGTRQGNFVLQNADLLVSLGCRMNIRMTGYTHFDFAKNASIVAVDIDANELKKPTLRIDLPICADAKEFLEALSETSCEPQEAHEPWRAWCRNLAEEYPVVLPEYHGESGPVNPYVFIGQLFEQLDEKARIVTGNGSACVVTFQAAKVKQGQRMFTNSGCASMGYGLPAAVGAAVASGEPVICIDGDGSIMMNLQELATVAGYGLPVKIFLLNNGGYHSMRQTQRNILKCSFVGLDPASGVYFPDFAKTAEAFGIPYHRIETEGNGEQTIRAVLEAEGPALCEVIVDPEQEFAPKTSSRVLEDGSIVSPSLDDMAPFLPREELEEKGTYRG